MKRTLNVLAGGIVDGNAFEAAERVVSHNDFIPLIRLQPVWSHELDFIVGYYHCAAYELYRVFIDQIDSESYDKNKQIA